VSTDGTEQRRHALIGRLFSEFACGGTPNETRDENKRVEIDTSSLFCIVAGIRAFSALESDGSRVHRGRHKYTNSAKQHVRTDVRTTDYFVTVVGVVARQLPSIIVLVS